MTQNGWPSCSASELDRSAIPGIDIVIPLQRGQPSTILKAFCADYHLFIESLYNSRGGTDEGGWTPTNSVRTSNHLGGTAVDLNWNDHPFHAYETFSREQQDVIHEILDYYEGIVEWGGECWNGNPQDEMHWQLSPGTYGNPRVQQWIDAHIRADGFSFYRKGEDIDTEDRKPVVPAEGGTSWADVSQYQKIPVNDDYPHSILSFRTNSGDKRDTLALQNAAGASRALDSGGASLIIAYYFFRPGQANCDLHKDILTEAGLWLRDRVVTMVDVESDGGKIKGDQSYEINDEIARLRGWYGNQRRVCGYWNPNADPSLWLHRPHALELVIPQYNGRPGDLSGVHDNIARREAFAHQYTDKATDVAPWSGQPVDMNWSPYSVAELLHLFGMPTEIKEPDVGGSLDLSAADLEILCGAIGAQYRA